MFSGSQLEGRDYSGWLSRSNALSAMIGLVTGAAVVLTMVLVGGGVEGESVAATSAAPTGSTSSAAASAVAPASDPSVAVIAAPSIGATRDRLTAQSLARPVRFGETSDAGSVGLAVWEERAFTAALAQEALAAVQPLAPWLVLTARSRARPVHFGDATKLTVEQEASIQHEEWWAGALAVGAIR